MVDTPFSSCMCMYIQEHPCNGCTRVQRAEDNFGCCYSGTVHLYFWDNVFTQPGTCQIVWTGWALNPRNLLVLAFPGLGLQDAPPWVLKLKLRSFTDRSSPQHPSHPYLFAVFDCLNNALYCKEPLREHPATGKQQRSTSTNISPTV